MLKLTVAAALAMSAAAQGPVQARARVGVYNGWAAFADESPRRCYAVSAPDVAIRGAFASVANWPERRVASQLHIRFPRPARPGSAILLSVDSQLFQLVGRGAGAWAAGAQWDRAIVLAMRTGVTMTVSARDADGTLMTAQYPLSGAASAIDAAALACRTR